jgi:hypothetical protein
MSEVASGWLAEGSRLLISLFALQDVIPGTHARIGSCRANGAIMYMLAGDGARIPVKLDITSVQAASGEKRELHHIAKVVGKLTHASLFKRHCVSPGFSRPAAEDVKLQACTQVGRMLPGRFNSTCVTY